MRRDTWIGGAVVLIAAGIAIAFVFALARAPLREAVRFVPDDTFYYLQLARHVAHEGRLTFDGVTTATGFHPLWMTMLVPAAWLVAEPVALLRVVVVLGLVLHLATGAVVAALVAQFRGGLWPWFAAAFWIGQRHGIQRATDGMETPLVILATALSAWQIAKLARERDRGGTPKHVAHKVGAMLALLYLARTDGATFAIVGIPVVMWLAWRRRQPSASLRAAGVASLWVVAAMAAFAATLWLATGFATQASAEMKLLWLPQHVPFAARLSSVATTLSNFWFGHVGAQIFGISHVWSLVLVGACMAAIAACMAGAWVRGERRFAVVAAWLLVPSTLNGLAYGYSLIEIHAWYTGQPTFVLVATSILALAVLTSGLGRPWRVAGVVLAVVVVGAAGAKSIATARTLDGSYPFMPALYDSVATIEGHVPNGERVGAFDAGLRGFFSTHEIVNLDGLVNDQVRAYFRTHRLNDYLVDHQIRYLADDPRETARAAPFAAGWPPLTRLACVADVAPFPDRCLYRVEGN